MSMQPYMSAYEGVFQTRSQFKDYLGWFEDIESSLISEGKEDAVISRIEYPSSDHLYIHCLKPKRSKVR